MDDVATEAGVGKGTLYRYFEDKDELYLALLERAGRQLDARIHAAVESAAGPQQQLEALAVAVLAFFDEQPHVASLIQRADAQRGWANPWQRTRDDAYRLVRQIFDEAARAGDFTIADPETAALLILAGLRAVIRFGSA